MTFRFPVKTQEPVKTSSVVSEKRLRHIRLELVPPDVSVSVPVNTAAWDIQMVRMLLTTGAGALGDRHAVYQQLRMGFAYFNCWGEQTDPSFTDSNYLFPGASHATMSLVGIGSNTVTTYRNIPRSAVYGDVLEFRINNGQAGDRMIIDIFLEEIY